MWSWLSARLPLGALAAAWVAAGDLVAGPGVAPGVVVAAVVAVAVDPTVAWAAATVTGSAPTRHVGTTTSRGGCSATAAQRLVTVRVALVVPTALEARPGCGAACVVAPVVAAEATGAVHVEGVPWVGAVEAVAPWAAAAEDHPWVAVGAALALVVAVLAVGVQCGAAPEGTEETGERGLTRCSRKLQHVPSPPWLATLVVLLDQFAIVLITVT